MLAYTVVEVDGVENLAVAINIVVEGGKRTAWWDTVDGLDRYEPLYVVADCDRTAHLEVALLG